MKLFAFNINTASGSYPSAAWEANFINCDCARAGVLYFFYLLSGGFIKPFISYAVIENYIPNTFLT